MDASQTLAALADGRLDGQALLGLDGSHLQALVEQSLASAEHGRVEQARELMAALAAVQPQSPVLALLLGHLHAQGGHYEAALAAYADAAARLGAQTSERPHLAADIELARAETELRLGDPKTARARLDRVCNLGSAPARARAKALQEGLSI